MDFSEAGSETAAVDELSRHSREREFIADAGDDSDRIRAPFAPREVVISPAPQSAIG